MIFIDVLGAGSTALSLLENRNSILRILRRLRRRIFHGTWRVPVFGDGGTGKTTLGKFLAGELDTDVAIAGYRETIASDNFVLPGEVPCMLLVPPGQSRRRDTTWPSLYLLLSEGKARGIINVVSWGYHATELEYERHTVYKRGMSQSEYLDAYLEYNRQGEITALNDLAPHLEVAKGKIWMITLITKQDLWWPERHNMERHYKNGAYEERIRRLIGIKGAANFGHDYYSVSLIPENLTTKDGHTLASTVSGYDQPLRIANLAHFVQGLNDLLK